MVNSNWGNKVGKKRDLTGSNLQKEGKTHISERNELCHRRARPRLRKVLRPERRAIHRQVVRREGMRNTRGSGIEMKFSAKHEENETGFQLLTSPSLPSML